jgi:hypothetical protein
METLCGANDEITLCKHLRKPIDANQRAPVNLTVEEIKIRARHGGEHAHSLA